MSLEMISCILLIDFVNDFNNKKLIYYEKSTLQRSTKPDITLITLHKVIRNADSKLIGTVVKRKLEAMMQEMSNTTLSTNYYLSFVTVIYYKDKEANKMLLAILRLKCLRLVGS